MNKPFTKSSEPVRCHPHSERPCPEHLELLMSGPTMTVLTRFTAIHVITRTMRRNSLLGTQSPLAYAAQDGQLHPEVVRLLTAVVVAKSAAAAAVNKFPLTWRMTTPSSLVLLPPTCAHPILCYAGRTHFLKSRSDHAPYPTPPPLHTHYGEDRMPAPQLLLQTWSFLTRPGSSSLQPYLQSLSSLPGTTQSSHTILPGTSELVDHARSQICVLKQALQKESNAFSFVLA